MIIILYVAAAAWLAYKIFRRLQLSMAKHPSLRGHAKMSRRISKLLPSFSYSEKDFYRCDGADSRLAEKREKAMQELVAITEAQSPSVIQFNQDVLPQVSDVQFTQAYRVPFPFRASLPKALNGVLAAVEADNVRVKDIDGNWRYDLFASYGVNVFGYDFYKRCIAEGSQRVAELGPVLGPYHPLLKDNVAALCEVSGLDEVSFHMSGTEAVMQAVRLARYHTRKSHLVRFCGAYHGWWDGVQPGVGNRRKTNDVYTLADLSENTIKVLETRNDIACILINGMQAMHPNSDAPSDNTALMSARSLSPDVGAYREWLQRVQAVCKRRGIVVIVDEVFTGFRLGYRGAQEYFGLSGDLVTYGKTVAGGLPIGVLCGRHDLMKRFRDDAPADVSLARGTFNSHPYVMGAMHSFLESIKAPEIQAIYANAEQVWQQRVVHFNQRIQDHDLPLRIVHVHAVLSVLFTTPSRYNWMLQFYLRAQGLEPGWVGTGRFIMSLAYTDEQFDDVVERFCRAAGEMRDAGWWETPNQLTNKKIKQQLVVDISKALLARLSGVAIALLRPRSPRES